MQRRMLKSKINRALVTATDPESEGSISIDDRLLEHADIRDWEQVAVLDVDNGARFETYAIRGEPGQVQLNGAAARLVEVGHVVMVLAYADVDDAELEAFRPKVVFVDGDNRPIDPVPDDLVTEADGGPA